jgi:hypothetical protein
MSYLKESPTNPHGRRSLPSDVDGLLHGFFRAEMPEPWPDVKPPAETLPGPSNRPWPSFLLNRSRGVLAASVLLLLLGYWFVSGLHSDAVPFAPGGNSGNNVGSRIDKSRRPRMNLESTEKRPTAKSTSDAERLDSGRR